MRFLRTVTLLILCVASGCSCGEISTTAVDAGSIDTGPVDAAFGDASIIDASFGDASIIDGAREIPLDAMMDSGVSDPFPYVGSVGIGTLHVVDIAVDAGGDVYVIGEFGTLLVLGASMLEPRGSADVFVARFSPSLEVRWAVSFGGTSIDAAQTLTLDGSGRVFVGGHFSGTTMVGERAHTSNGATDAFLFAFDANDGAALWSQTFGAEYHDDVLGLAVTSDGRVVAVGSQWGQVVWGTAALATEDHHFGYVASFDALTGELGWARLIARKSVMGMNAVVAGTDGEVYVSGDVTGNVEIAGLAFDAGGSGDGVIVRVDRTGSASWARRCAFRGFVLSMPSIAREGDELRVVANGYRGTLDCGLGELPIEDRASAILRISIDGELREMRRLADTASTSVKNIVLGPERTTYVAGWYTGRWGWSEPTERESVTGFIVRFGPGGAITATQNWWSDGGGATQIDALAIDPTRDRLYVGGWSASDAEIGGGVHTTSGHRGFLAAFRVTE
jgi:hypothetical protein